MNGRQRFSIMASVTRLTKAKMPENSGLQERPRPDCRSTSLWPQYRFDPIRHGLWENQIAIEY
jgi:hypothetical protein